MRTLDNGITFSPGKVYMRKYLLLALTSTLGLLAACTAKPQESARKLGDVSLYIVSADPNSFSRYMIYYFGTNAKEEQLKIRFQTSSQRTYRNRKGKEEYEAEVMIVTVS